MQENQSIVSAKIEILEKIEEIENKFLEKTSNKDIKDKKIAFLNTIISENGKKEKIY